MKKIMTWLGTGALVAMTATACSVEVSTTTTGTAGSGGTGGSGGSTGGSGGTTGGSGGTTGGTAGTAGTGTAGTGGSAGTGGTTDGGGGSTADASSDAPKACEPSASDSVCKACAFVKCKMDHCACVADTVGCGPDLEDYYKCLSKPGADSVGCAIQFTSGMTRNDAGAGLANELATCMDSDCADICAASADAGPG